MQLLRTLISIFIVSLLTSCDTSQDDAEFLTDSRAPEEAKARTPQLQPGAIPPGPIQPGSHPFGPAPIGTGVFSKEKPSITKNTSKTALCVDCDIYIISVCSLRKDHVGLYANLADTPNIDRIAQNGIRFERAYSASNFTLAGLTAVLTGRYASSTGVSGWDKGLSKNIKTLPEILGFYGYRTAAFGTDAASGFRPDYGLDKGFQHMEISLPPPGTPDGRHLPGEYKSGEMAVPMKNWLSKQDDDTPVFVMIHSRTAHYPFVGDSSGIKDDPTGLIKLLWETGQPTKPAEGTPAMPGSAGGQNQHGVVPMMGPDPVHVLMQNKGMAAESVWRKQYRLAVEKMDADVGVVYDAIKQRGRLDKSIIILLGDHGESLNDHGEILHGDAFFDSVINVPLIVSAPFSLKNSLSKFLASHVDIMPTILSSIGAVIPEGVNGISLEKALQGQMSELRTLVLSEGGVAKHSANNMPGAVIAPPWALLRQRRGCGDGPSSMGPSGELPICLFNIETDPGQTRNLASSEPNVVSELQSRWDSFRMNSHNEKPISLSLTKEFIEELRVNGYDFNQK